jgi:hypothetical protein
MYGKLKGKKIKKHISFWETVLLVLIGVFTYWLAGDLGDKGIAQKWATATMATLITFGFVINAYRERLFRWSFWVSLTTCLVVHVLVVWFFFQYVLFEARRFSILFWYPFMLVEVLALLIVVKRIEEKLTGEHETIKLRM